MENSPAIVAHDAMHTSSTPASSIETTPSNGEVEYEYYEENHPSVNGNVNMVSSTESKGLTSPSPKDGPTVTETHHTNGEKTNYDLFHPSVHPKLEAGVPPGKSDSKNTSNNGGSQTLLSHVLLLALLLPLFKC